MLGSSDSVHRPAWALGPQPPSEGVGVTVGGSVLGALGILGPGRLGAFLVGGWEGARAPWEGCLCR